MSVEIINAMNNLNISILFFLNQFNSEMIVFITNMIYVFVLVVLYLSYRKGIKYFALNSFWFLLLYGFTEIMKQITQVIRPCITYPDLNMVLYHISSSLSFPSRHTAFAFFLLAILPSVMKRQKNFKIIYCGGVLVTLAISISRIVLGVHYPSDVIAGAIIGFAFGKMILMYKPELFSFNYLELKRQVIHFSLGIFIVFVLVNLSKQLHEVLFLFSILSLGILVEIIYKEKIFPLHILINEVKRKKESAAAGAMYFIMGSVISCIIFPKMIALMAILILASGDSFATIFGTHFKTNKLKFHADKSVGGSAACFLFSFITLLVFFDYKGIYGMGVLLFLVLSAMAGTVAELIDVKYRGNRINDNITMPVISGIIIWGLYLLFGLAI